MGGRPVLVTSSPTPIHPAEGDWKTIRHIIEGGLGHAPKQLTCFYGWLKTAIEATRHTVLQPGQAVVFCGPREGGKSLLQKIITVLLGGREARPFQFMTGKTSFNASLFGAEHLVIEDEAASTDLRTRRQFGAVLKMVTANESAECHAKFKEAISLTPIRRLTISVNDEPEHLMVLPPLDESIKDKIILFKFEKKPMPVVIKSPQDRENFFDILLGELPAFAYWLQNYEIPEEWKSSRFGVRHYHHPEIVESIDALSPEARLLSLIDMALFGTMVPIDLEEERDYWEGEANELERILLKDTSRTYGEAKRLLYYTTACGFYLSRLQKKHPFRISERRNKGRRLWKIRHPDSTPENALRELPTAQLRFGFLDTI